MTGWATGSIEGALHHEILERFGPVSTLTVKETAELIRVSVSKIYALQDEGRFPCLRVDTRKLVPVQGLISWLVAGGSASAPRLRSVPIAAAARSQSADGRLPLPDWL